MSEAEDQIRAWFDDWLRGMREGDRQLLRRLIDDDAVIMVPGAGTMDADTCADAAAADDPSQDFDLDVDIREIEVHGDIAWVWTEITLIATDRASGTRSRMAGHALSILKRVGERWLLVRDANTVLPVPPQNDAD